MFLLVALRSSRRPADREHPLGYGRTRFFWSLLAAMSIFVTGVLYSGYEGIRTLTSEGHDLGDPRISYIVLALAFVLEPVPRDDPTYAAGPRPLRGRRRRPARGRGGAGVRARRRAVGRDRFIAVDVHGARPGEAVDTVCDATAY